MNSASKPPAGPVRRALDLVFDGALYLAAVFMVGVLVMVLAGVVGRIAGFNPVGSDAYAGYCMAAASFLALANTLKRAEHIRVMLVLERLGTRTRRSMEVWCHAAGCFFCGALAYFSIRLVVQSREFNDISQASDGTPLWIPEIAMALGTVILFMAMADNFWQYLTNRASVVPSESAEFKAVE
jgi:TRAP-type C4-dicarboxylate transport system permease small subunit